MRLYAKRFTSRAPATARRSRHRRPARPAERRREPRPPRLAEARAVAGMALPALRALAGAGALKPLPPARARQALRAARALGLGAAGGCAVSAARDPHGLAVIDERGTITFAELNERAERIAAALRTEHGVGPDRALARHVPQPPRLRRGDAGRLAPRRRPAAAQHRLPRPAAGAGARAARAGRDRPRRGVRRRARRAPSPVPPARSGSWPGTTRSRPAGVATLDRLAAAARRAGAARPAHARPPRDPQLRHDRRAEGGGARAVAVGGARPAHHAAGAAEAARRRPDRDRPARLPRLRPRVPRPRAVRRRAGRAAPPLRPAVGARGGRAPPRDAPRRRAGDAAADPRAAGRAERARRDTSSLRAVGLRRRAARARRRDRLHGRVRRRSLFNLYGSTETGFASWAGPADLRAAPGTVGRPPRGVTIAVLDEQRPAGPAGHGRDASSSAAGSCSTATPAAARARSSAG